MYTAAPDYAVGGRGRTRARAFVQKKDYGCLKERQAEAGSVDAFAARIKPARGAPARMVECISARFRFQGAEFNDENQFGLRVRQ